MGDNSLDIGVSHEIPFSDLVKVRESISDCCAWRDQFLIIDLVKYKDDYFSISVFVPERESREKIERWCLDEDPGELNLPRSFPTELWLSLGYFRPPESIPLQSFEESIRNSRQKMRDFLEEHDIGTPEEREELPLSFGMRPQWTTYDGF
ncbi:MAG: hypothetical protein ACTSU5_03555 [Promethearchaeota archaeon]